MAFTLLLCITILMIATSDLPLAMGDDDLFEEDDFETLIGNITSLARSRIDLGNDTNSNRRAGARRVDTDLFVNCRRNPVLPHCKDCGETCFGSFMCKPPCVKCRLRGFRGFRCQRSGGGSCFPGSSQVQTADGSHKAMWDLRTGDVVMTLDNMAALAETTVLGFLDKDSDDEHDHLYIAATTESGRVISLSENHLVFYKLSADDDVKLASKLGKEVVAGDLLMTDDGKMSRVIRTGVRSMAGAFVPLTSHGTLLVDGILASCYTNVDHGLAHAALAPARLWPTLFLGSDGDTDGLRAFPAALKRLARFLGDVGAISFSGSGRSAEDDNGGDDVDPFKTRASNPFKTAAPADDNEVDRINGRGNGFNVWARNMAPNAAVDIKSEL